MSKANVLDYIWHHRYGLILSMSLILIWPVARVSQKESNDALAFTVNNFDGETSLMLYDPQKGESKPIFTTNEIRQFSFSSDGHLAFPSTDEGNTEIYVLDTLSANQPPINISQNPDENDYPLAWSPDGHYLAFESYHEQKNALIYVWDGEKAVNITPDNLDGIAKSYSAAWSFDGRLAFTVVYDVLIPSEIYLWDGKTTTNLSQNPTGEDSAPTWNTKGQLAFTSERNGKYDIFVWDGSSIKNGSPNVDTFANIAPELTGYYSFPAWTNDDLVAFVGFAPQDKYSQIYVWDGLTATNISQNPTLHNGIPGWNSRGQWAFSTYFSPQQLIYVRDADSYTLLTVEGQYVPAWSSSGYLAFCTYDRPDWILSIWDGQQVVKVTLGRVIQAQWNGGSGVYCSSG